MAYLEELLPEFRKGAKIREWNWDRGHFIYLRNENIYNECGEIVPYSLDGCSDWFLSNKWEIYNDPELDWQYIIDNKCLCWFWDSDEANKILGILIKINENKTLCHFICQRSEGDTYAYALCRPVRRDEVTFYEDKKDD